MKLRQRARALCGGPILAAALLALCVPTAHADTVVISPDRHHIGDGRFSPNSNCAPQFRARNRGPTYSESLVILEEAIETAVLVIDQVCGLDAGRPGVRVTVNFRDVAQVGNGSARVPVPVDILKLGGKANVVRITAQDSGGDIDDLEFEGIRLEYTRAAPAHTPPQLALVRIDGTRIEAATDAGAPKPALTAIQPFRVELRYDRAPPAPPETATLRWEDRSQSIALTPADGGKLLRSPWLYLGTDAGRDYRQPTAQDEANTQWTYRLAAELFAGRWAVTQTDADGTTARGAAVVAEDGTAVRLVLETRGGELRTYDAFSILATRDRDGPKHTLNLQLRAAQPPPPAQLVEGYEQWPAGQVLHFAQASSAALTATAGDQQLDVTVTDLRSPPQEIDVALMGRSSGRYAGQWSRYQSGHLGSGGQQTWMRDPVIEGVIVLDDVYDAKNAGDTFAYPFGPNASRRSATTRSLFVYGRNLPTSVADARQIESAEPQISYALAALEDEHASWHRLGWEKAGIADHSGRSALVVTARLAAGVTSGVKTLLLNGLPGRWHLDFSNAVGRLAFAHGWRENEYTPTDVFYASDVGYVVIDDLSDIPHAALELVIRHRRGETVVAEHNVSARRVGSPNDAEYQSPPLRFMRGDRRYLAPPQLPGALTFDVRPGDTLQVEARNPFLLRTLPRSGASATIRGKPSDLGTSWKDALMRVARCHRDSAIDFSTLTHEAAETYSKFILTELGSRHIRITKGDHAAALLLRDEVVKMLDEALASFRAIAGGSDEQILQFMAAGRATPKGFWRAMKAVDPAGRERRLHEIADFAGQARAWRMSPTQAQAYAVRTVRTQLRAFIATVEAARARARNAGDCNVMELLVVAGRSNEAAFARILPRLVRLADDGGQRQYWEPDFVAQGYVKGLGTTGAAVRALDAYAAIDDGYKAMALALVTGGLAYGLSAAGYAASAGYLMLTADAADMLYFGGKDVYNYFEGHALAEYARGLAPAVGDDFLAEAELAASEWYWAALGVIAPGIGVGTGIKELRQLRKAEAIGRGARLLARVDDFDAATLARLSDAERADLAAVFTDLQTRKLSQGADALSDGEHAQLAKFERYFDAAEADTPAARPLTASGSLDATAARPAGELPPVETLASSRRAASEAAPAPPAPRATVETPRGMPPVPRQRNSNTCGVAAAQGTIQRLTGEVVSEQDLVRRSVLSGRGYSTGIDFETGELVRGGVWPREMVELLEDAGVQTRVPYGRQFPDATLEAVGDVDVPRRLGDAGARRVAADPRLENPRFTLDDATREIGADNQVLAVVDYRRTRGADAPTHWVVVEEVGSGPLVRDGRTVIDGPYVIVGDPAVGRSVPMARADFEKTWVPESTVVALNPKTQPSMPLVRRGAAPVRPDGAAPPRPRGATAERPGARVPPSERVSVSFPVPERIYRLLDDPNYGAAVERYIQAFDSYTAKVARGEVKRSGRELDELYHRLKHDRAVPADVKEALVRQFGRNNNPDAGIVRLFDGRPPSSYVSPDPDLGFSTTTTQMRQEVYRAPYRDPFTFDPQRTSRAAKKPAQLEADHVLSVDAIKKLDWDIFRRLTPERQQRIIYDARNIQPLDPELNRLKSNLSARKFQDLMQQKGRPLSSHYVDWLEDQQREMERYFRQRISDLYRDQLSRGG